MNENGNGNEGAIKEALSAIAQQKMLEFFNRGLILEANLAVAQQENGHLLNTINDLQEEIETLTKKSSNKKTEGNKKIEDLYEENSKLKVDNETLETRMQDLANKVNTGYKPKIRELEDKIKEME
ncbi:uncharacterized protein METZ01_LOCUS456465 [marine metagenome]|uniref:Uncharacterized protein n=1 Tax=marine metagenome TaxID=408172 RepID=A0A383A7M7_9ZZZZ